MTHKSVVICAPGHLGMRLLRRFLWLPVGALLWAGHLSALAVAQNACAGIHVAIPNVRNNDGAVACALFSEPEGFPTKFMRFADKIVMTKIEGRQARCDFISIKPGTYALAVIHDENLNGELDTNFWGVPTEGYGFSSGAKVSMFKAPSFSDAQLSYDGEILNLEISLKY